MKGVIFLRNTYKIKSSISQFFKRYKVAIFVLACFFVLGLVTGIITATKYSGNLELENIPDDNLIKFLCGDKSNFGVFFSYLLPICLALILIIFCNFNFLCSCINALYILIRGYSLGFTIYALVGLFSFGGIIGIIVIVPFWLIIDFSIILISSICVLKNHIIKQYGKHCYANNNPRNFILFIIAIMIIVLFILCMVMPVLKITIIVN